VEEVKQVMVYATVMLVDQEAVVLGGRGLAVQPQVVQQVQQDRVMQVGMDRQVRLIIQVVVEEEHQK